MPKSIEEKTLETVGDICRYYDQAKGKGLIAYAELLKQRLNMINSLEISEDRYIKCLAQELDCLLCSLH